MSLPRTRNTKLHLQHLQNTRNVQKDLAKSLRYQHHWHGKWWTDLRLFCWSRLGPTKISDSKMVWGTNAVSCFDFLGSKRCKYFEMYICLPLLVPIPNFPEGQGYTEYNDLLATKFSWDSDDWERTSDPPQTKDTWTMTGQRANGFRLVGSKLILAFISLAYLCFTEPWFCGKGKFTQRKNNLIIARLGEMICHLASWCAKRWLSSSQLEEGRMYLQMNTYKYTRTRCIS